MAAGLTQMARSAPEAARGERPVTTYREDLITAALTVWPITAMFFDGRGHNNETGQESFFSLAHLFLYAGMTAVGFVDPADPRPDRPAILNAAGAAAVATGADELIAILETVGERL
jgi:hypothetical protein